VALAKVERGAEPGRGKKHSGNPDSFVALLDGLGRGKKDAEGERPADMQTAE
jgi:hypothetical protein